MLKSDRLVFERCFPAETMFQADLTWKLVPLYDCPGEEGKACVFFVCPQLAILIL